MRHYAQMYGVRARLGKRDQGGILSPDTPTSPGSLGPTELRQHLVVNPERVTLLGVHFHGERHSPGADVQCCFAALLSFRPSMLVFPSEGTNRGMISKQPELL